MASSSSHSSSSSSSTTPWEYDVFLSFRGEDTRRGFVDHLYDALSRRGIQVFKDDSELGRGRPISDILPAIAKSRFSLIVFSKNFASSSWCLDELVQIFECCRKDGARIQTAFPIFYLVDPSEVQEQTGRYGEAFLEHERVFEDKIDQVHRWKKAMTELANLSGWHLQEQTRGEVDFIREVVDDIHTKLRKSDLFSSIAAGDYIGMDSHLEKLSPCLNTVEESNDVRFVGICGMGGIGKSTLARFVYSKMSSEFYGSSFLENIRVEGKEGGLAGLQRQLLIQVLGVDKTHICNVQDGIHEIKRRLRLRKVLVILDNVDHLNLLKSLAGASDWFGRGSRIIITTRDEHLLQCHGVSNIYRMGELGEDEALKLFSWRAFGKYTPAGGYEELSREFIAYASRLPLALTVLGSHVHGRGKNEWENALEELKKFPNKEILENLRISVDSLKENEREIFLHIACFFVGEDVNYLMRVLKSCEFFPVVGMRDLIAKSLITISESKVRMHDLVQQLGQEIVRREHKEPGCRSRIWLHEDLRHILSNDTGSEQLEGIVLNVNPQEVNRTMSSESFLKMKNLRLLILSDLHCLQGLECLPNEVRYLKWNRYPFESFPSSFHPDKLVELHLSHSNIKQLWKREQPPLRMLNLKVINLSFSRNLIKIPDLSEAPNLQELILQGCTGLHEVHQSIGVLKRLVLLNLKDCKSLKELPSTICDLKSLKNLILHGCSELHKLPERLGDLTCLEVLDLGRDVANGQPPTRPWDFRWRPWQLLRRKAPSPVALTLPSLSTLRSLRDLNLSYCKLRDGSIPNDLGCFPLLESLDLSGNDFKSLPSSIDQLSKVLAISFADCKRLQSLPGSICGLSNLGFLELCNCSSIKSLPDLPTSVEILNMDGCASLEALSNNISELSGLCQLKLTNCVSLRTLPVLPSSIGGLRMDGCSSLEAPPDLSGSLKQTPIYFSFVNCLKLAEKQDFLKSFLHSILKNKRQGLRELEVSMSYTGGGIPGSGWFNHVSRGASLKVELPPYWFNNEWLGFSIFVVFGAKDFAAPDFAFSIAVKAWITTENPVSVPFFFSAWSSGETGACFNSDVVLVHVIPRDKSKSADWWNSLSHLEVSSRTYSCRPQPAEPMAKCIGFRIVYDQNVEELSRCNWTSQSPPFHNVVSTNKRSHDDDGCSSDSEVETRPSSKRLELGGCHQPFHNVVSTNKRSCDDGFSSDSEVETRPGSQRLKLKGVIGS